jgi:chemotaxis protein MotA
MLVVIGIIVVFGMVFGGFTLAGGKMDIIIYALPFEMMIIGGAAAGAFMISNKGVIIKQALGALGKVGGTGKWKKQDYVDLLCLLFALMKLMRSKGMIALEPHVENPESSAIFTSHPRILADSKVVALISDSLRMVTMNFEDPGQLRGMIDSQLSKYHREAHAPANSILTMADAIPALGIVAAVLGVIKTMASIDQPVIILGGMIGSALVGTFLGVFLSYGLVGPVGSKLKQIADQEHQFYVIIRDVLVASMQNHAPQVAVEIGRGSIPSELQPNFAELEQSLDSVQIPG